MDVDPRTEGAASREIVFPLNLDSEVQKPRASGPSAWGVRTKAATKQSLWSKTQSRPAVLSACCPAVAGRADRPVAEAGRWRLGCAAGAGVGNVLSWPFWLSLGSSC